MLASQRKNHILKKLFEDQHVSVKELANNLKVSFETIRRDLKELENKGFLVKTHGGGVLSEKINSTISVQLREKLYINEKKFLAREACKLITNGSAIFLDSSTTSLAIARNIMLFDNLTIFTNSLLIAQAISKQSKHRLILAGGNYNPNNGSFVGTYTQNFLSNFLIDVAFISPTGLSIEGILTDFDEAESFILKQVYQSSRKTFVVIDKTKLLRTSTYIIGNLNDFEGIIINTNLPQKIKKLITNKKFLSQEINDPN